MTLKQLKSSYADLLLQIDAAGGRKDGLHLIRKADNILATIHSMEQRSMTPTWDDSWASAEQKSSVALRSPMGV